MTKFVMVKPYAKRKKNTKEVKKLDELFSEYIRRRAIKVIGGCERCGLQKYDILKDNGEVYPAWKQLQTSHIIGRTTHKVRWDEDNAFGLCAGCHMYLEHHPIAHEKFAREMLGDKLDLLVARSTAKGKVDKGAIKLYLQYRLKEVENVET